MASGQLLFLNYEYGHTIRYDILHVRVIVVIRKPRFEDPFNSVLSDTKSTESLKSLRHAPR